MRNELVYRLFNFFFEFQISQKIAMQKSTKFNERSYFFRLLEIMKIRV